MFVLHVGVYVVTSELVRNNIAHFYRNRGHLQLYRWSNVEKTTSLTGFPDII